MHHTNSFSALGVGSSPQAIDINANFQFALDAIENESCIFVTGKAGTGKSTFIHHLSQVTNKKHVILAPTGIAALNIGGQTIHSFFQFPLGIVERKSVRRSRNQSIIQELELLIIDEVSMVRADLMDGIDIALRLNRGKWKQPFGGVKVLLVGDACLGKGEKVTLANGQIVSVEHLQVGDQLMGPDGLPRKILRKKEGFGPLYRIEQTNGNNYIVNENHQVVLKRGVNGSRKEWSNLRYPQYGNELLCTARELMSKSRKFRECFVGYKAGLLEFPTKSIDIDPYYLGIWLGDGDCNSARITTADSEIVKFCEEYAQKLNINIRISPYKNRKTKAVEIGFNSGIEKIKNVIKISLERNLLIQNKHIPDRFLFNSSENRLRLLAGLIDSDGHWSGNRYTWANTNPILAQQFKQLSDQLGFRTSIKKYKQKKKGKDFYIIQVSGDTWRIPCRVDRKKSKPRNLGRSRMTSTLKSVPIGDGEYVGIETDGEHLFLLADGTVVHNCQLSPITKSQDEEIYFSQEYASPYFFSAKVFLEKSPLLIEFTDTYRQRDEVFLRILNEIREGSVSKESLSILNDRVSPFPAQGTITLTTTNIAAAKRNAEELKKLTTEEETYVAQIDGVFEPSLYPTEGILSLKKNAQIMMLRNDPDGRWVNGTIGTIGSLGFTGISVIIDGKVYTVKTERWENTRYTYDMLTRKISKEVLGSFEQFPVKLAYAVTIHKSQSKTFDKVHIDLSRGSFAHGQTYVALSRCTSLEGLTLSRPLKVSDLIFDRRALEYQNIFRSQ